MNDAPKIEFPCEYPIKVVGALHDAFQGEVLSVVANHSELHRDTPPALKVSSGGKYGSLTVTLIATSEVQLKALHKELMTITGVKMVL